MADWTFEDAHDQTGRTAIVTGANTGIGFETARMLALRGARVVLACRDQNKGQAAVERILRERGSANVALAALDLADLTSVARFAAEFSGRDDRLDLLIHNAGVMVPPFARTQQGFELQFGTNHLGHFALAAQLWPRLAATSGARLVVISSSAAHMGRIDFDDPNYTRRRYHSWPAYCQSKLANSLFALELARRSGCSQAGVAVTAAHPGWTATDLQRHDGFVNKASALIAMKAAEGALPTLRAAVDPRAGNGSYWGPSQFLELKGPPLPALIARRARDPLAAKKLWTLSEELTGVAFELREVPEPEPSAAHSGGRTLGRPLTDPV
jgi:NAD(P)-dependent dehydrogenase (short-subunit alcohol dehydrogenase family)